MRIYEKTRFMFLSSLRNMCYQKSLLSKVHFQFSIGIWWTLGVMIDAAGDYYLLLCRGETGWGYCGVFLIPSTIRITQPLSTLSFLVLSSSSVWCQNRCGPLALPAQSPFPLSFYTWHILKSLLRYVTNLNWTILGVNENDSTRWRENTDPIIIVVMVMTKTSQSGEDIICKDYYHHVCLSCYVRCFFDTLVPTTISNVYQPIHSLRIKGLNILEKKLCVC